MRRFILQSLYRIKRKPLFMNKKGVLFLPLFYLMFTLGIIVISLCSGLIMVSARYAFEYMVNEVQPWDVYFNNIKLIFVSFTLFGGVTVIHLMFTDIRQYYKKKQYRSKYETK